MNRLSRIIASALILGLIAIPDSQAQIWPDDDGIANQNPNNFDKSSHKIIDIGDLPHGVSNRAKGINIDAHSLEEVSFHNSDQIEGDPDRPEGQKILSSNVFDVTKKPDEIIDSGGYPDGLTPDDEVELHSALDDVKNEAGYIKHDGIDVQQPGGFKERVVVEQPPDTIQVEEGSRIIIEQEPGIVVEQEPL